MSFKSKTILGIAAIEAVLLFTLVWNSMALLKASNQNELINRAATTAKLFATMTKDAVLSMDLDTLDSFIDEILKNAGIVYARVVSRTDGVLVEGGGESALGRAFSADVSVDTVTDGVFDMHSEIEEGGIVYGFVEIGIDINQIQTVLVKARKNAIILAGIEMILTALFSYFLGSYLTRQLEGLTHASERIANGELGYQIRVKGKDELAQAAVMFNKMSADLKHTYAKQKLLLENSHRASRRLALSEERLRAILEQAVDGIITIDTKGVIESFNPAAEKIFGFSAEEMVGRNVSTLMPESLRKKHQKYIDDYMVSGVAHVVGIGREVIGRHKNGTEIPLDLAVSEIKINESHIFTGMVRDISSAKQAAEEIKKYQENLEKMVVERTQKLEQAHAELVTKAMEAAREQMSAMVLHNIGNAITPTAVQLEKLKSTQGAQIINYLEKCYQELKTQRENHTDCKGADERGEEIFAIMGELIHSLVDHEGDRNNTLSKVENSLAYINDTLVLQQTYASNTKEMKEMTDLNALIEDALRMQLGALEKRGIVVSRQYHENLPKLLISKNRLMQVLVNVIKNSYEAIDAMEKIPPRKEIHIKTFLSNGSIGFQLKDNGIGLTNQQLSSVFELGQSHKGSSGIGLYYCKMFINSNGGRLDFTSPGKGKGATLTVGFDSIA